MASLNQEREMVPRTAEENIQEQQLQIQRRLGSECAQRQQYPPKQQQQQVRRWRLQLSSYLSSSRTLLRPRHLDPPRRRQNQAHPKSKQKEDNKTTNSNKSKGEYLECSVPIMKSMHCKEEQEEEFDHDKQRLQQNGCAVENRSAKEGTRPRIDNIAIPTSHCSDSLSNLPWTPTPTTKQPCVIESPFDRFEVLERLGYGSSGSSIFKAIDRWDNFRAVAIKKIPLTALTDPFSLSKDNEVPQEDIDYFVSWIVDHYGGRNKFFLNPNYEEYSITFNSNDNDSNINGSDNGSDDNGNTRPSVNHGPNENAHVQQRRSLYTKENTRGLNQVVKSLGFLRNDAELWLALELCAGGSVADLIRLSDGPMTESEIGWIMSQILLGLAYLHSKDHVHGDIKASNILLTLDGHVKLGGSGAIMSHREGAGERKRRRRSLTMSEFPVSWLAPESNLSTSLTPTPPSDIHSDSTLLLGGDEMNDMQQHYRMSHAIPGASTEADVWALGVACIEVSQGRPPRPETPILASYGDRRYTTALGNIASIADEVSPTTNKTGGWCLQSEALEAVGMGMSEEMWMFIRRCLTPDPEARPTVQDLLQDPFIVLHDEMSQELLLRIGNMVDFVGQCASISEGQILDSARSDNDLCNITVIQGSTPSSSVTLSPSRASQMIDFKIDETDWFIPRVRPRVDSDYDESSFFDEAGVQRPIGPLEPSCPLESLLSAKAGMDWKHQRMSHPKAMQALMCDQPRYLTFRHSRSPSLATIVEYQMEEDALFWSDDEGNSDDGSDNGGGDNNNVISTYPSQQYNQQCMYTSFQESQSQSQQQPWTTECDKGGMEVFDHVPSQVANSEYLDSLSIESGTGFRSIVEYDFHGASSCLVVLYEIRESKLQ